MSNQDLAELGIVDTHVHFWQLELLRRAWQPPPIIFRTFGPPDLIDDAAAVGVKNCVLVEAGTTAEDNRALAEFAESSEFVAGMISYANLESPTLEQELDALSDSPKFRGVRMRCEGDPDAEILTRPGVIEGMRKVAQRGLVLDLLVVTDHLKAVPEVYERVPDLKAIIDHIGKPDLRRGSDFAQWRHLMRAVAEDTDAYCKMSIGPRAADMEEIYVSQGQGWQLEQLRPRFSSCWNSSGRSGWRGEATGRWSCCSRTTAAVCRRCAMPWGLSAPTTRCAFSVGRLCSSIRCRGRHRRRSGLISGGERRRCAVTFFAADSQLSPAGASQEGPFSR